MQPFDRDIIAAIQQNDLVMAATLDANGLLLRGDDDWCSFADRLVTYQQTYNRFESQLADEQEVTLFDSFKFRNQNRITPEIMAEAAEVTRKLYHFSIDWVPGFFLSRNIGPLWGGCAITDPEDFLTVFLVRNSFADRPRWFIYSRRELLSHELCHAARMVLDDNQYEEHFAYQTAHSRLRRYIGNCFQTKYDALLFLLPILLLLGAEIFRTLTGSYYPIWPFWCLAGIYPFFLICRNQLQRNRYFKARASLMACGCSAPEAVLFRCNSQEMKEIATRRSTPENLLAFLRQKSSLQLKWQVIMYRFFDNGTLLDLNEYVHKTEDASHDGNA